ncbi:MAG: hypothetical protein ABIO55_11025 [Ginsengibacter sp.]
MNQDTHLTAIQFTRLIVNRLYRYRYVIIVFSVICGVLLGIYIKGRPINYTSKATIFSLNSSNETPTTSSALSLLLGTESGGSFSAETSININELAQSRTISEAVAAMPVPSMGNKIIATLLIEETNRYKGLLRSKIIPPKNKDDLITEGGLILRSALTASINKNNSFILTYSGTNEELVKIISYNLIDKISAFYIDLKREKAKHDYEFASNKVDSLRRVLGAKDYTLIAMDKRTLFTNTERLQYKVPAENLVEDKLLIRNQYSQAVINQQSAAYKLQKDTPLIRVLDKPDPPFDKQRRSWILYCIIGLLVGGVGMAALIVSKLLLRYTRQEVSRALFGAIPSKTSTTTTTIS